jgi:DNA-binding CsgD family transcriptional regulator
LLVAVERAEAAQLLHEASDGTRISFAHALIRETLYEGMMPARRRLVHRHVAEVLAALPEVDVDAVAFHFQQASDERAATWLLRAGEHAEQAQAWLTAAARYEAALALAPTDVIDAERRVRLLIRIAWHRRFADPQPSIASLADAERLALAAQKPALAAVARATRGKMRCYIRDMRRGLEELRSGVAALDALAADSGHNDAPLIAEGAPFTLDAERGSLQNWLAFAGHYDEAARVAERVTPGRTAPGLGHLHAARGRPDEARAAFSLAVTSAQSDPGNRGYGQASMEALLVVVLPYAADDLSLRRRVAREGAEASMLGSGALHPQDSPQLAQLPLLVLEGGWAEARDLGLAVYDAPIAQPRRLRAGCLLAQLARQQGEPTLAWRVVREWLPEGTATAPGDVFFLDALALQRLAAALALDAGELAMAKGWLEAHDRWLDWGGVQLGRAEAQLGWATYNRAAGDPDGANHHATQALALASAPRQPLALLAAHRLLGELATDAGRFDDAVTHLATSLTLADACAAAFERALTLLALAALHAATDTRAEARACLDEVRTICTPLGAQPTLAKTAALAARLATLKAAPHASPAGLSAREVEVLRLVAAGRTNAEIAAALSISKHTVIHHVTHILAKTQSDNRVAAAAYALHHDLI